MPEEQQDQASVEEQFPMGDEHVDAIVRLAAPPTITMNGKSVTPEKMLVDQQRLQRGNRVSERKKHSQTVSFGMRIAD